MVTLLAILLGAACCGSVPNTAAQSPRTSTSQQPDRNAQQRVDRDAKIDSQLLQAIRRQAGETKDLPVDPPLVNVDRSGRALVDVRADVSDRLIASIRKLGGRIVSSDAPHRSIIARIPLDKVRLLAEDRAVRFIGPAPEATTRGRRPLT